MFVGLEDTTNTGADISQSWPFFFLTLLCCECNFVFLDGTNIFFGFHFW